MKTGSSARVACEFLMTVGICLLLGITQIGCGGSDEDSDFAAQQSEDGQVPTNGYAGFATQCAADGSITDPKAEKLELWSCPINVPTVELTEPLTPLLLSADCKRKLLTIRTMDRSLDTTWEVMPDGSFYITLDGLSAKLKSDGSGNSNCTTPLNTNIWGKIDCAQPDQAKIHFETVMWLNKQTAPAPRPSGVPNPNLPVNNGPSQPLPTPTSSLRPLHALPTDEANRCALPEAKCYFHVVSSVQQCT